MFIDQSAGGNQSGEEREKKKFFSTRHCQFFSHGIKHHVWKFKQEGGLAWGYMGKSLKCQGSKLIARRALYFSTRINLRKEFFFFLEKSLCPDQRVKFYWFQWHWSRFPQIATLLPKKLLIFCLKFQNLYCQEFIYKLIMRALAFGPCARYGRWPC